MLPNIQIENWQRVRDGDLWLFICFWSSCGETIVFCFPPFVISVRFLCHFRSLSWDDKTAAVAAVAAVAAFIYLFIFFRLVSGCFGSFSLFHSVISVAFQFHFLPIPISLAFQPDSSEKTGNAASISWNLPRIRSISTPIQFIRNFGNAVLIFRLILIILVFNSATLL